MKRCLLVLFFTLFIINVINAQTDDITDMDNIVIDNINTDNTDTNNTDQDDLSWLYNMEIIEDEDTSSTSVDTDAVMLEAEQAAQSVEEKQPFTLGFEGYIRTSLYFRVSDYAGGTIGEMANFLNQNVFSLGVSAAVSAFVFGKARVNFRNYNFSDPNNFMDLGDRKETEPYDIELEYAEIQLFDLGTEGLNVTIGKILNSWGEAFLVSPIDLLNPEDLSDPTDFTKKLCTTGISIEYNFLFDYKIEITFKPLFTPTMLPTSVFNFESMSGEFLDFGTMPSSVDLSIEDQVTTPKVEPENFSWGARFMGRIGRMTFGAVYYYGFDDFPYLSGITIDIKSINKYVAITEFDYLPMQVAGLGLKFIIGNAHIIAEGGVFIPRERILNINIISENEALRNALIGAITTQIDGMNLPEKTISDEPFGKAVLGFDYLYGDGYTFYVLYMYGFFFERRGDAFNKLLFDREYQSSLLILNFQKEWTTAGIRVELAAIIDAGDFQHSDGWAVIINPSITYLPIPSMEITLKGNYSDAYKKSYVYLFRNLDLVSLSCTLLF